jgi:hypothetical protein
MLNQNYILYTDRTQPIMVVSDLNSSYDWVPLTICWQKLRVLISMELEGVTDVVPADEDYQYHFNVGILDLYCASLYQC